MKILPSVRKSDIELYDIVAEELARQRTGIEMIASKSYVSTEILELQVNILTNMTL